MSDSRSFRTDMTDDEWDKLNILAIKNKKQIGDMITSHIRQELLISKHEEDKDTATLSAHRERLENKLKELDLSKVIVNGTYNTIVDDLDFIQEAKHNLAEQVTMAARNAVGLYWMGIWAKDRLKRGVVGFTYEQQVSKMLINKEKYPKFREALDTIKVTFTVDIPVITLSALRESYLSKVVQFDCLIVGPTPKKLDTTTGKYIQYILIQEPESTAVNNNPVMIKAVMHGDDTNNIASGMRKRIIGIYTTQEPKEGTKATNDKTLIIDVINVSDLEEKAEVTLSQYEIETSMEFAEKYEEKYIKALTDSFCPKILGRELEKKALYLSLLGGSDIEGYRSESHIMLVGEADTGKSEMVKFANQVAHKSSIIDGANATGVGILFALDEYDGLKILRQGAMILNDGGHLIVDEYDKMDKKEQKKLNQSMEQQWASYNKGGHKGEARCRTAIIASCNPEKERWNEGADLIDNLPFDASTISRFDLMIRLKHQNHENQIRAKMLHITKRKRGEADKVMSPQWMKGLINYQRKLKPVFNEESEALLIDRFVEFTQIEQDSGSIEIQTRQMEGISRLCEAWGKMLFVKVITIQIVEDVIAFYQECMATLGMNVEKGITQFNLAGYSVNRDVFFEDTFRTLASESDEGTVSITELSESLQENTKMFNSDTIVAAYVEKRKMSGWLFEPHLGELKRQ